MSVCHIGLQFMWQACQQLNLKKPEWLDNDVQWVEIVMRLLPTRDLISSSHTETMDFKNILAIEVHEITRQLPPTNHER
jgi:hypothetical protein